MTSPHSPSLLLSTMAPSYSKMNAITIFFTRTTSWLLLWSSLSHITKPELLMGTFSRATLYVTVIHGMETSSVCKVLLHSKTSATCPIYSYQMESLKNNVSWNKNACKDRSTNDLRSKFYLIKGEIRHTWCKNEKAMYIVTSLILPWS